MTARILLVFSLFFSVCYQIVAQTEKSVNDIFLREIPAYSPFSFYAIEAESGKVLAETNQLSLSPASTQKLMTTAVALSLLGADFRFETKILMVGKIDAASGALLGDLIISGGGDPAFYSEYFAEHYQGTFEEWADKIAALGIKKINGELLLNMSAYANDPIPGGWIWEDIGNYYGAGVSALTYRDNLYRIYFKTDNVEGNPAVITRIEPQIEGLLLENKVVSSSIERDLSIVYGAPGSYSQQIKGTIPKGRTDFVVKGTIPNPADRVAADFLAVLHRKGIEISRNFKKVCEFPQTDMETVAIKQSPSLSEILVPLNRESINLFAEHLLCEVGRKSSGFATLQAGIDALKVFCEKAEISVKGYFPKDGSGLSRSNAITARTLAETINYMYNSTNRLPFVNSLAAAGRDGTLKNIFKGTPLENNLRGKTGSMERVRSMAGIFRTSAGKQVVFGFVINNSQQTSREINLLLQKALMELYNGV